MPRGPEDTPPHAFPMTTKRGAPPPSPTEGTPGGLRAPAEGVGFGHD